MRRADPPALSLALAVAALPIHADTLVLRDGKEGIAGGGKGAGIGVLGGRVGGTILAATSQPHLKIPAKTRLQFQLIADWKVQ